MPFKGTMCSTVMSRWTTFMDPILHSFICLLKWRPRVELWNKLILDNFWKAFYEACPTTPQKIVVEGQMQWANPAKSMNYDRWFRRATITISSRGVDLKASASMGPYGPVKYSIWQVAWVYGSNFPSSGSFNRQWVDRIMPNLWLGLNNSTGYIMPRSWFAIHSNERGKIWINRYSFPSHKKQ